MPRKPLDDDEMDITPMIDITFLLLIFFLVASKMDPSSSIQLPKARNGMGVVEKNSVIILVTQGESDQAAVRRGDGEPFSTDLEQQEQEIQDYVLESVERESKEHVLIKAERGVKYREVDRVARAVGGAREEGGSLHVAVLEVQ